jgi:hypothetical protein
MIALYGFGRVHRQVISGTRDLRAMGARGNRSVDLRPAYSTKGAAQIDTKEN